MTNYHDEFRSAKKEVRWTFFSGLPLVVLILVIMSAIGFAMNSLGLIGSTIVEREVFKQSYQRSASIDARIANDEAVIVEIIGQLQNPNLDDNTRFNLEAQKSAARVRINTARGL